MIGRTVTIETTSERIHCGRIQSLFVLNGERAIHIQTNNGENLIFTASQLYNLAVHYDPPTEEMLSPIPRRDEHEVIVIDDEDNEDADNEDADAEVEQIIQRMEVIQICSDNEDDSDNNNYDNNNYDNNNYDNYYDDDATTEQLDDEDNHDDFPDVEFQPARHQRQDQDQEEPHCCAICLDATDSARNFVSLDCGHQFHFACIISNMAAGVHNSNSCPMCRSIVLQEYDVHNLDEIARVRAEEMVERAASQNQHLQDELELTRQHREDLSEEYMRVMSMNLQIGLRHNDEREARDALERRAYICGLNERIAAVVTSAVNNDIRRNGTAAVHVERQIRDLCMSFGMMAYDAQYDEVNQDDQDNQNDQYHQDEYHQDDMMEVD